MPFIQSLSSSYNFTFILKRFLGWISAKQRFKCLAQGQWLRSARTLNPLISSRAFYCWANAWSSSSVSNSSNFDKKLMKLVHKMSFSCFILWSKLPLGVIALCVKLCHFLQWRMNECWVVFDLILYVPSTIFQLNGDRSFLGWTSTKLR